MSEGLVFKPKARIILQLGDQLIRNESIALLELIKNSYDACADTVTVKMSEIEHPDIGEIIIEDDGVGMEFETLRDIWLQPGTTYKKNFMDQDKLIQPCGRIPLGEKGIGRFGVHKLGEEIELVTKKINKNEAVLKINWTEFEKDKLLDKVPINLEKRSSPIEFLNSNSQGTKIIIRKLRGAWTRGMVREIYRAITSLHSPFSKVESFKVKLKLDQQQWLSGLLSFKKIKSSSLFYAEARINGSVISNLEYKFTPWTTMKDLKPRKHSENQVQMRWKVYDESERKKVWKNIDIADHDIGEIRLKLMIFDLDNKILSLGVQDKKGLKDYLRVNGGVRVFREGVRVYDYGEPGNDWLGLDSARVNRPALALSNNIVVGAVEIDRKSSLSLVEKTNREGFIEDSAFQEFSDAVRFAIGRISTQRNIDKDKLRNYYNPASNKEPVISHLADLKATIQEKITDKDFKEELFDSLNKIESDYKTITEIYIKSASAGLSLSVVIHEIDKIISELVRVVDEFEANERIKSLTNHLGKLVEGYSGLIRRRPRKEVDLRKVLTQALWNIEFRLSAHNISVTRQYEKDSEPLNVKCSENLILGAIINIIDNSIWWLNYAQIQRKAIYLNITTEHPGYLTIIIADNGPGFSIPVEEAIKPFISNKDGGMGIGLHLAYEIMNAHGGELMFPEPYQFKIPNRYKTGAIVALAFKI